MTQNTLEDIIKNTFETTKSVLINKSREYSDSSDDKLIAFKRAAALSSCSEQKALFGMLAKHFVSIADLCNKPFKSNEIAKWDEKITDTINYLILLKAINFEQFSEDIDEKE